jgi:methylmalonyl-CoA mutase
MSDKNDKKLFEEFPPVTIQQWEEQIIKDLKGADYEKKLVWNTPEGIRVKPYYAAADTEKSMTAATIPGESPFVRSYWNDAHEWAICEEIYVGEIDKANQRAVNALSRGADSINFVIQEKIHDRLSEVIANKNDLSRLLKGIDLTKNRVNFIAGCNSSSIVSLLEEYFSENGISTSDAKISFDYDVIGHLTLNGNFCFPKETVFNQTASYLKYAGSILPHSRLICVNGQFFANAGATLVQELAFSFAVAADYLARLTDAGVAAEEIFKRIRFTFGINSNYFMEIAKLRAFRWLWTKIQEQYIPAADIRACVHSVTCDWNKTAYDPHVNILRSTTEAMSAILGGATSVTVRPFDAVYKSPDDFSRRIARNIQIILKEEAYLNKVSDIAGGSYYIETLTESVALEAWKLFLDVQEKGGYVDMFMKGEIQQQIADSAQKRDMAIASRQQVFIGTNQYPNQLEKISENVMPCAMISVPLSEKHELAKPIRVYRGALEFENLRLEVEKMKKRPKVFLLTYGNLAMRKARAGFSSGFFGCAGYEIIDNLGFDTPKAGAEAALKAKADITVICSSDDEYPAIVPEIMEKLKGKTHVVLAGYPKDHIESFKAMGIEHFIHVKSNLLETLKEFNVMLKK